MVAPRATAEFLTCFLRSSSSRISLIFSGVIFSVPPATSAIASEKYCIVSIIPLATPMPPLSPRPSPATAPGTAPTPPAVAPRPAPVKVDPPTTAPPADREALLKSPEKDSAITSTPITGFLAKALMEPQKVSPNSSTYC